MPRLLWLFVASAALAACHKPVDANSAATSAQPAAPTAATSGEPQRRAGLWEATMSRDGHASPMGAIKTCVDQAMSAKPLGFHGGGAMGDCGGAKPTRALDGSYHFSATCRMPSGGQSVIQADAAGDWSTSYHIHVVTDSTGAPAAALDGRHVIDTDAKWLGPCPAGMAGGDIILGNGMKISGGKLAGAAEALKGQ